MWEKAVVEKDDRPHFSHVISYIILTMLARIM